MGEFEIILALLLGAVTLAALARRVGVPYPAFLALGGAVLAFIPGAPSFSIDPDLALAVFVAPVLLDAAYDASPRDLRQNWGPVASLAIFTVVLTTIAVAVVVRRLAPGMPWAPAVALGAIVSPPDAVAAVTVLRQLKPPHRVMTVLESESLLNDATALMIFRLSLAAAAANGAFSIEAALPTLVLGTAGSLVAGPLFAWVLLSVTKRVRDPATSIVLQFVSTFGVWIVAERLGLSSVLTTVCYAIALARRAPEITPARLRLPSYAVWDTVVFVLNVLAFVFIGLQIRPILLDLSPAARRNHLAVAVAVLLTVIVVRIAWVLVYVGFNIWRSRRFGAPRSWGGRPPTFRGALVVAWCGMRGIVSLAAALSLPTGTDGSAFPYRDLIVLTSFFVVIGTLLVQGLTLRPLLEALDLHDDDPVGREVNLARRRALSAALGTFEDNRSAAADVVREELATHLRGPTDGDGTAAARGLAHGRIHRRALAAARQTVFDMRATDEIGDDAFHQLEEELDWLEMGSGVREEREPPRAVGHARRP